MKLYLLPLERVLASMVHRSRLAKVMEGNSGVAGCLYDEVEVVEVIPLKALQFASCFAIVIIDAEKIIYSLCLWLSCLISPTPLQ